VVAKRWIEALIAAAPFEALAEVPVATLADEAPALCATLVRALGSEDELSLLPLLAANAPALAGARDVQAAAAAVGALRDAVFTAVLDAVEGADAAWTARLARRTAYACDRLLEAAVVARPREPEAEAPPPRAPQPPPQAGAPDPLAALDPGLLGSREGAPPWERMVARAVGRHLEDGQPFALLAVEAGDAERLLAAEGGAQALERADRALGETVRARDRVVSDPPARWWALVPEAGAEAGRALARRIAEAVGTIDHAGAPLRVAVGLVVCPKDGADAEALVAAADERLLMARASGDLLSDG
jgi:GGDEF domain-containing protein